MNESLREKITKYIDDLLAYKEVGTDKIKTSDVVFLVDKILDLFPIAELIDYEEKLNRIKENCRKIFELAKVSIG